MSGFARVLVVLAAAVPAGASAAETRVYFGDCLFAEVPAVERGIGAAVVTGFAETGLERLGLALAAAGMPDTVTVVAQRNFDAGESGYCMQLVHGRFAAALPEDDRLDRRIGPSALGGKREALSRAGITIDGRPDLFLELRVRTSADGSAWALAPTFLGYARRLEDGRYRARASRLLAVQARLHPPGVAANERGSRGATLLIGDVGPGTEVEFDVAEGPGGQPHESAWFPAFDVGSGPYTLTVSVSETREARPFYLFLADLLDASQDAL